MRPLRRTLLASLLLLPLLGGATYSAATHMDPATAWSAPDTPSAAPGAADLVPARRAAMEAGQQAGFLAGGTSELAKGAKELDDGTGKLATGAHDASTGAGQLAQGMVELQAGTGQLGSGAVQVADGVQKAVDQVQGLGLIQAQIITEIDRISADLEKNPSPDAVQFRKQLADFRVQVQNFKLDAAMVDQLAQLRSGSREIANQLNTPGYGYHDGIYSATKGSKELAAGLQQLDAGLAEAQKGSTKLSEGATKVDGMATRNKEKVGAVQRALPADPAPVAAGEPIPVLIPLLGFLIAALVMVGGSLTSRFGLVLIMAMGALAALLLATDLTASAAAFLVGGVVLAALAAAFMARALVAVLGPRAGSYTLWGLLLLQVGLVGWAWKAASVAQIPAALGFTSALLPMHYATSALTAAGNSGSPVVMGVSMGVLAACAACGFAVTRLAGGVEAEDVEA